MEDFKIKWLDENTATRKTKEVDLICKMSEDGRKIELKGTANLEAHLMENTVLLLNKMAKARGRGQYA